MRLIVLGMHRSGTSILTGLLELMGFFVGSPEELMQSGPDNPKGFWERQDVVDINGALLDRANAAWDRPLGLEGNEVQFNADLNQKASTVLSRMNQQLPWVIKDPRMCITLPAWNALQSDCAYLLMTRHPESVARSLHKRNEITYPSALALWEHYCVKTIENLSGNPFIAINFETLCTNFQDQAERLKASLEGLGFTGLAMPNRAALDGLFDPTLIHHRAGSQDVKQISSSQASTRQLALHECMFEFENNAQPMFASANSQMIGLSQESLHTLAEHEYYSRQLSFFRDKGDRLKEVQENLDGAVIRINEQLNEIASKNNSIEALQSKNNQIQTNLENAEIDLRKVEVDLCKMTTDRNRLHELIRESSSLLIQFTYSTTWKFARAPKRLSAFLLKREIPESTLDHLQSLLFEELRKLNRAETPIVKNSRHRDAGGKLRLLTDLSVLSVRNPGEAWRQVRKGKLRAVYRAMKGLSAADAEAALSYGRRSLEGEFNTTPLDTISESDIRSDISFAKPEDPLVSIIIPVYDKYDLTLQCLNYLNRFTDDIEYEVILADDASTDDTATIETHVSGINVVRQLNNQGFLINCNLAAQAAKGKYLLFLNNDTRVQTAWLSNLLAIAEKMPEAAIVGPKLLFENGVLQEAGGIIWQDASGWNYGRGDDSNLPQYNYVKRVDYISGACLLVRYDFWKDVGGFDTRFAPAYYEDTDLCFQARKLGLSVIYQPASRVVHLEGMSHGVDTGGGIKKYQSVNQVKFRDKWATVLDYENYKPATHVFKARERVGNRRTMLVIDHYVPEYDRDAGSRSTFMYLKFFVTCGLCVKFLGDNFFRSEPYTSELEQLGIEVLTGNWYAKNWKQWLQHNAEHFDYIMLHRPHITASYIDIIRRLPARPKIFYIGHDLHFLRAQRQYETDKKTETRQDITKWRTLESEIFNKSDVVYYFSEVEVEQVKTANPSVNVRAIPLNILNDKDIKSSSEYERQDLLFVGGFNHPPNVDAFNWFYTDIFPAVLAGNNNVKIIVIGSRMPKSISDIDHPNIVFRGTVSDEELYECYARAKIAVVPLRYGAGVKGKVIEAMRLGVPVVTTRIGAEGIPGSKTAACVADESEKFAGFILGLYSDDQKWIQHQSRGLELVRKNYSETAVRQVLAQDMVLEQD